jgi:hypothetical protein
MFGKILVTAVSLLFAFTMYVGSANAQATRTWISGVGDDANPCSRTAPCKTFAGAISKTAAGGEIDCLDPGGFGTITITKSITLDCASGEGGQVGSILASGVPGIVVAAATTDTVIIRNLSINGIAKSVSPGLSGVKFLTAASVTIDNVNIFDLGGSSFAAILFTPSTAGEKLFIHNTNVTDNLSDGIVVQPSGSVATMVTLDHVTVSNSGVNGIRFYDGVTATVSNSLSSHNGTKGVFADAVASGPVVVNLINDIVNSNGNQGVVALGASTVTLDATTVTGNVGVGVQNSGGTINTLSNNAVYGNSTTANATPTQVTPY